MSAHILVVHHTPSPAVYELLDAITTTLASPELAEAGITFQTDPALSATASDMLAADGYIFLTPTNIGYISGALKHFFDTVFYPVQGAVAKRPYAAVVHGNNDTSGALRALTTICSGMGLTLASPIVSVTGAPTADDLAAVTNATGVLALAALG